MDKKRMQRVRDIYALVQQLNDELGRGSEDWGDAQDELETAMQHLKVADAILGAPDEEE